MQYAWGWRFFGCVIDFRFRHLRIVEGPALDANKPLLSRYSVKANIWIAIFGFIGNYWYTHYFYSVLRADYTMPSWTLARTQNLWQVGPSIPGSHLAATFFGQSPENQFFGLK